ncbi:sugar kinase [Opitutaceae bacterium EW11]|nr:sugar kinase [Opitutaceae bacterium EW11]
MNSPQFIGIDLGGTKCAVSVPEGLSGVKEVARFSTSEPASTIKRIFQEIDRLAPRTDTAFGVSCGGPLDARRGIILSPPNLPGWDHVPICDELVRRYGGRAWLMNDANASALAEWQSGAGRGSRNMVFLTMGTGMGAGLILDGRLYEGTNGNAGEVGHIRLAPAGPLGFGKEGSFEGFCSGGGIARLARIRISEHKGHSTLAALAPEEISARDVAMAAAVGDELALAIWSEVGSRLGEALSVLVDVLNPERIVIGSIFARCERFIAPSMQESLVRESLDGNLSVCLVVPGLLGEQIGSHAAIAVARYHSTSPNFP